MSRSKSSRNSAASSNRFIRAATMAGITLAVLGVISVRAGNNETPKKTNAIFFSVLNSGNVHEGRVKVPVEAENYSFTSYKYGGNPRPTLAQLRSLGTGQNYAVFVLVTHAGEGGIVAETFNTAADRDAALKAYKKNPDLKDIANEISAEQAQDRREQVGEVPAIGITTAGLKKIFGGADGNRSIFVLAGCNSNALVQGGATIAATERLGFNESVDDRQIGRGLAGGFLRMTGDSGIPKRPVKPAFEGLMSHFGPGNTPLAPALTAHTPAKDAVLPLNVATPGSTNYDTKMNAANTSIMVVVSGCEATISNQAWQNVQDGASNSHTFSVTPTKPGRLILKVVPDQAVSRNNNNRLIGNLYVKYVDMEELEEGRKEVNDCQFGTDGLDGLRPYSPPHIPYRWCVWCDQAPSAPTPDPRESTTPKNTRTLIDPYQAPWGETLAFVLYEDEPGPDTVMFTSGGPPNLLFDQVGPWYGHLRFTPQLSQVGNVYDVLIETHNVNGLSTSQFVPFTVVNRVNRLTLSEPGFNGPIELLIPVQAAIPGEPIEYDLVLENTGNTRLRQVMIQPMGFFGPGLIPPSSVQIEPPFVDLLMPGAAVPVHISVQTQPGLPAGDYVGGVQLSGLTALGDIHQQPAQWGLTLNRPAVVQTPPQVLDVRVGEPLELEFAKFDPDGHAVDYSFYTAPADATLTELRGGQLLFSWLPGPKDTGFRTAQIEADDGVHLEVYPVRMQVEGPVNVNMLALDDSFDPMQPISLEIWYTNRNNVTAVTTERIEVFEMALGGPLLFDSGPVALGSIAADEELVRNIDIPPLRGMASQIAIRVTAQSQVSGRDYTDSDDLTLSGGAPVPATSPLGAAALLALLLIAGGILAALGAAKTARNE